MHVIRRIVLFLNFILFLPPDNQFTQKSVAQLSHIRLGPPSRFFYFSMQITRKCASIGRRGKFENSIVFGLVNNFRRVFGQSTVHLMCRCVVQTSGVREWTVFLLQHASQLLYVVRGRLLQLVKGKNNPELWILHLSTPNQSQSLFLFWLLVYA